MFKLVLYFFLENSNFFWCISYKKGSSVLIKDNRVTLLFFLFFIWMRDTRNLLTWADSSTNTNNNNNKKPNSHSHRPSPTMHSRLVCLNRILCLWETVYITKKAKTNVKTQNVQNFPGSWFTKSKKKYYVSKTSSLMHSPGCSEEGKGVPNLSNFFTNLP